MELTAMVGVGREASACVCQPTPSKISNLPGAAGTTASLAAPITAAAQAAAVAAANAAAASAMAAAQMNQSAMTSRSR